MFAKEGGGADRLPFDVPVEDVEADIVEGYAAYLDEIVSGEWPGVTLLRAITFAEYRRDYWREMLPHLIAGTY